MEFFIGTKKYSYTEDELDLHLISDTGLEACVYNIKGQAVKIYKKFCRKVRLNEKEVEELKKYDTERLLLPIETVYNRKGEFNGYTTRFINGGNLSTISKMKMHKMLDEMNLYTEDVKLLTKNGVLIDDLYIDNIVYGDGLYSCDPGSFKKEENMTEREIERENKHILNELFINDIFGICCGLTKKQRKKLEEMVLSGDYLSDLFSYDDINKNESTLHFMKRITKQ